MQVEIAASPAFAFATITLPPGGEVKTEAGAMAAYSDGVEVETKAGGGFMKGLRRSVLGGESFFMNTFRSSSGGSVSVAPALPGDMTQIEVDSSQALMVQSVRGSRRTRASTSTPSGAGPRASSAAPGCS